MCSSIANLAYDHSKHDFALNAFRNLETFPITFLGLEMFLSTAGLLNYYSISLEVIVLLELLILGAMPVSTVLHCSLKLL